MNNYKNKIYSQINSMGPNLKIDLNRALEVNNTIAKEGFFVILFNLFIKAKGENYDKLNMCFPKEAMEFEKYKNYGIQPDDSELSINENFK